jgi:hypothetical protein
MEDRVECITAYDLGTDYTVYVTTKKLPDGTLAVIDCGEIRPAMRIKEMIGARPLGQISKAKTFTKGTRSSIHPARRALLFSPALNRMTNGASNIKMAHFQGWPYKSVRKDKQR